MISDEVVESVVGRLLRDTAVTTRGDHSDAVRVIAELCRQHNDDRDVYESQVVGRVQQHLHDTFVDTSWPRRPSHPRHPMWFDGGWWCADGHPYARLGELAVAETRD